MKMPILCSQNTPLDIKSLAVHIYRTIKTVNNSYIGSMIDDRTTPKRVAEPDGENKAEINPLPLN